MRRAALIHWKAEEAGERLAALRRGGFAALHLLPKDARDLRRMCQNPPDAFVIDLGRLPSQGLAIALEIRRMAATRGVPILFAGGLAEKVARIRAILPDAAYAAWEDLPAALENAMRQPPEAPLVPGAMAGYSGTPLARKLGIKPGSVTLLAGAPEGFAAKMEPLPEGARIVSRGRRADRVLLFVRSARDLERRFQKAADAVNAGGGLWIVWPKQASALAADVNETGVRRFGLGAGWVDYKICAVDDTWSGLLFARRK